MPHRSIYFLFIAPAMTISAATSSPGQTIETYRVELSGEEVVPPSGQPGSAAFMFSFPDGGPCSFGENEIANLCIHAWDVVGEPIDLRLGAAPLGENADSPVVLRSLEGKLESCVNVAMDWPDCDLWERMEVYVVLTTTAFPDGELRGQCELVYQPTVDASWGSVKRRWTAILAGH